jgi:hypothetical protein
VIEEAQNESKSEQLDVVSMTSSIRIRRTLFNSSQGNYDLRKDKLTEENIDKEFGDKSNRSNNRIQNNLANVNNQEAEVES